VSVGSEEARDCVDDTKRHFVPEADAVGLHILYECTSKPEGESRGVADAEANERYSPRNTRLEQPTTPAFTA
jgi:hypothetical protein